MIFFYWLIAVMPLDQHWFWGREIFPSFTIIKILGLLSLAGALIKIASGNVRLALLFNNSVARWFLASLALLALGALRSHPEVASVAFSHLTSILILFLTVLLMVDSPVRLHRTVLVAIGAAAFASLYTIKGGSAYPAIASGDGFRPSGIFSDANQYALIVDIWAPVAFLLASAKRPSWERLFCFGCLVAILMGTTLAASRGGFLGLLASVFYLVTRSRKPIRNLLAAGALIFPLVLFSPSSLMRRVKNPALGDQQAQVARIWAWKGGLKMMRTHPLLGIGMHNFKGLILQYEEPEEKFESLAHNSYLEIGAEDGIPAMFLYIGLLGATFWLLERCRRRLQGANATLFPDIALGLQAGLISYIISSFFMSAWWEKMFWLLIFLTMCLHRLRESHLGSPARDSTGRLRPRAYESMEVSEPAESVERC